MYFNINDPAQVKTQSQFDAKLSNIYFTGASFVIETITEYLTRVKDRFRFAGTLVTILLPKDGFSAGSFSIKSFSSVIGNFDIKYYAFIDGIGDSNFIEIPIPSNVALSLIGLGTKENPFTLVNDVETPGPNKYYGTSEDGEKGWQPVPGHHDPVTIATGSLAVLQIDNNQVLSITLPTPPEQVNADWNATSGPAEILNKPDLSPIPATTTTLGSVIVGGGLDILPDGTLSVDFTEAPSETDPTVSSYTKGLTSATTLLNEIKTVDGHLSGLDADLLDGYQASDFSLTTHKHYQLYQPDGTNPFVYTNNSDKLFVDGVFQTESAIISSLAGTGLRLATLSAATGAVSALTNGADGTFLAMVSGSPTWTISIPTIKLTSGATDGYYWKCTNSDGSGGWFPIAASQVYKGTINGSTGIPTVEVTPLIDGNGSLTGWYYRCVIAGTYDYGDPSGNSITLAVGDDIYYNGSIWQKIPGQGYTLQPATTTVLGGVKIGSGVTVQLDGTISVSTAYRPDTWVPLWSEILNKTTTEVQEGTNLYYTDERAQDAVGTILTDTTSIDFLYDDFLNQIKATVLPAGVDHDLLLNFVGNEHIDHSLVSVTGTGGLGGGGNLTTSRTITHNAKSWVDKTTLTGATVISNLTIDAYGHPTDWTTRTLSAANIGAEPTVTKQNVTAGSNKISLGGAPTSSVFSAFSIDVNEGNLTLNNIGGVLGISKGGTNLSSLGSALQLLRVNSSATALEYWTPNYLTGNQNITWTASGDISGSASGTTSLSPSLTVNAIKNKTVPTLSPGYFYYDGSAWIFKNENYSLDGHTHTQYLTDAPSNGALYGRKDGAWTSFSINPGTVTNVSASVPTGLSVSVGNPSSTPAINISYSSGYAIPTTTKQGQWDTAYTNMGKITLDGGANYYPLSSFYFNVSGGVEVIPKIADTVTGGQPLPVSSSGVATALSSYQLLLVSGTNIKTINGSSILGSGNLSIPTGVINNAITFNNSGSGATSGTTFDGSVARTISYNTIGAAALAGSISQAFSVSQLTSNGPLYLPSSCNVNASGGYIRMVNGSYSFSMDSSGNGMVDGTMEATNFILRSDRRLKENIRPIETSHQEIEFVEFNMIGSEEKRYGVIAQQVEEIAPELVRTNEDGKKSVAYIDLLIRKIAELEARIKVLENDSTRQ